MEGKNYLKRSEFLICISFFILFSMNSYGQDQSVKDLRAAATQEIKKEKIDSGKTWKTGGLFNLNFGQGSQSN